MKNVERHTLAGHPVDAFTKDTLLHWISERVAEGGEGRAILANLNLHGLSVLLENDAMSTLLRQPRTRVHIDGMPIAWMLRAKGHDVGADNRLTYLDWAPDLLRIAAERGWKVAFVGGEDRFVARARARITEANPSLEARYWNGFGDVTAEGFREELDAYAPDILFCGMGMPRQEAFLLDLDARFAVGLCAGAFLEYIAGEQPTPPRFVGRMGLEWAWRLAGSPSRYASRYLIEPFGLARKLAVAKLNERRTGAAL